MLPVRPPVAPMLARLSRTLPVGDYRYEPKWDGFRCLAFRDGREVDLRSRHDRPFARYFPELVDALRSVRADRFVLDGEVILASSANGGAFDFATLMGRLHPATSRAERLSREAPASYVAFDLLALGDTDVRAEPFAERRALLEQLLAAERGRIILTPATADHVVARRWFEGFRGAGVDGVIAKPSGGPYEPGRRTMIKVKHERTADCVVAGMRLLPGELGVSSLLLALYDETDDLRHVGVVTQFPQAVRAEVARELGPLAIPLRDHPWHDGFHIGRSPLGRLKGSAARWTPDMEHDWVPLRPERVAEVGFDQVDVDRFRHPARFRRWRPDRTPESCRVQQIAMDQSAFAELVGGAA